MTPVDQTLEAGLAELRGSDPDIDALFGSRGDAIARLLDTYLAEIERFNPAYSLVGARDRQELVVKHILDSLAPLGIMRRLPRRFPPPHTIADAGSGAGLPGIPLAMCLPETRVILIERMGRRAGFLRNTLAVLGLSNVTVEETEMEKAAPGRCHIVTFRAFRPLEPRLLKGLFRLCADGGLLAAYKGRREKIEEEMQSAGKAAGPWEALPCPVPFLAEERHLLTIKLPGSLSPT
ncbi:MAG: 16S rRNA (guanine(527)-N(7))-methyltransferase RsmG [Treponema sp.]|jgi:16S rRNA (guanine527-N7)-methyltransferase|nr:16S rRNA (guanine(527)-N(7))-methyltransferase RsmG [Treponema sp.]